MSAMGTWRRRTDIPLRERTRDHFLRRVVGRLTLRQLLTVCGLDDDAGALEVAGVDRARTVLGRMRRGQAADRLEVAQRVDCAGLPRLVPVRLLDERGGRLFVARAHLRDGGALDVDASGPRSNRE